MPLDTVSEVFMEWCLVKGERHTGIFANMSFAEKLVDDLQHQLQVIDKALTLERIGPWFNLFW